MGYEYKNTVYTKFYNEIFPQLAKLEKERVKELTKFIILFVVGVVFPVLYFCNFGLFLNIMEYLAAFDDNLGTAFILGAFFAAVLLPTFAIEHMFKIKNNFKRKIKRNFTDEICCLFGRLSYTPGDNIMNKGELKKSTLFSMFNAMYPDDSFEGEYKRVKYRISELKLAQEGNKGGPTVFKGVVITFNSNKKIKALTTIVTKSDFNSGNGLPLQTIFAVLASLLYIAILFISTGFIKMLIKDIGLSLTVILVFVLLTPFIFLIFYFFKQHNDYIRPKVFTALMQSIDGKNIYKEYVKENYENNNEINLEDVEFAKKFKVFSNDEIEARYLVTTAFMERFLNMTTAFGTNKAKCAFCGNQIIFAITTKKDLFELGSIFKPLTDTKNIGLLNELMSILEMIDYFKLDEKNGL